MELDHRKAAEKIMARIQCPKDFECYRSGFKKLSRAKDVGMLSYVQCLEDNSPECKFAIRLGDRKFCDCALRVYIAKHIENNPLTGTD